MELNANQTAIYENIQSKYPKVDKATIIEYLSGNMDSDAFLKLAKPEDTTDQTKFLESSGYDVNLMKTSIEKIKRDIESDEKNSEFDLEGAFNEYKPSNKLLFQANGIRTDQDLSNSIRGALSLSSNNLSDLVNNTRQLILSDLTEQYGEEKVKKFSKKVEVRNQDINFRGYKTQGLIYKIPKELGGDGKFYAANKPGLDTGDFFAVSGDLLPISMAIAGGTFGSAAGPAGTVAGSAGASYIGEIARLYLGRKLHNFNPDMDDDEFFKFANASAAKYAAIDAAATAAFLPLAAAVKTIVLTTPKDKLSKDTIKKFLDSGGMDKAIKEPLDKARKDIMELGVEAKSVDNYLAVEVAKALPRSGIIEKGTKADKAFANQLAKAENAGNVKKVESEIMKKLTGLNELDNVSADKAIRLIEADAKQIRNLELANVSDDAAEAFKNIQKTKNSIYKTDVDKLMDEINIDFAGATKNIETRLGVLSNQIDNFALTNKIRLAPMNLDTIKTADKLLKSFSRKKVKKLSEKQFAKLSPEAQNKYINSINVQNLFDTLGAEVNVFATKGKLNTITKGLKSLKQTDVSLKDAVQLRTLVKTIDETAPDGPLKNVARQLKGELNTIIDDALSADAKTAAKVIEFDDLLNAKRQSFFQDFAQNFGYGTSKRVKGALQYEGPNIFNKFIAPGPEGLKNSAILGTLINNRKVFNAPSKNRIKAALYEKYLSEVAPQEIGKKGRMEFTKFKDTFGKQYENILGKKDYKEFFKNPQSVINEYDKIIKNTADVQTTISKALPGIDVNVLDAGAPGTIVNSILKLGNKADIKELVKNLNKQSPDMLTNVRQVFLNTMLKSTRTQNADLGVNVTGLNGEALNIFLNQNRGAITQLFDQKFFDVHRSLANALEVIQSPQGMKGIDSPGLTGAANKAGLFVDIFAGPLNHKRLVINRIARIYDGFDLGGDSLNLLRDYNLFLNGAKKNFLAGNYPKVIDDMLAGTKAERNFADRAIDKVNKFFTLSFSENFGRRKPFSIIPKISKDDRFFIPEINPLIAKEYLKEKLDQSTDIGEPAVFEPVDIVAEKVADGLGVAYDATIKKLVNGFLKSQSFRRAVEKGREFEIFESETLEKDDE